MHAQAGWQDRQVSAGVEMLCLKSEATAPSRGSWQAFGTHGFPLCARASDTSFDALVADCVSRA